MVNEKINGTELSFNNELHQKKLFSPEHVDEGTRAMLSLAEFKDGDIMLDLGCGYGAVGIYAAKTYPGISVTMCDISKEAVETAKINAAINGIETGDSFIITESDGFSGLKDRKFTLVLSNPPYHTDFSVAKHFIEDAYKALEKGGRMYMVTKRLDWYRNKLTAVFGGTKVSQVNGYYVFMSQKRDKLIHTKANENHLSKKLSRKAARRGKQTIKED